MLPLPTRRLLVTSAVGLLLAGCTVSSPGPDATITLDEPAPSSTPEEPAPPGGGSTELAACSDTERRTLVATVDGQLDAIADGAWAEALSFATPDFRAGIDAESFATIITDSFPVVAGAQARDIGTCQVSDDGAEATMVVTVQDGDGARQALLYLFEQGEDGWGIGGALPGRDVGEDDEPQLTV